MAANTETIIINPIASLVPGSTFLNEQICVDLTLNFTADGGSFSISLLQGAVTPLPVENTILSLPFGRVGIVKNVGNGLSTGGLLDTISGPILPLNSTLTNFYGIEPKAAQFLSFLAAFFANPTPVFWDTLDVPIKSFSFRGQPTSAIRQLASYMLADMIVRKDGIYIVDPGAVIDGSVVLAPGQQATKNPFIVPKSDIVSATQSVDYNSDVTAILNPALTSAQLNDQGDFVYDSEHAQKQPKTIVQAGTANSGFTPIPDGWIVDGTFEEWTPVPGSGTVDNPAPSVGRYWKQFPSPTNVGAMRGITGFARLIKDFSSLPGNISTFIGSPITATTGGSSSDPNTFNFLGGGTQNGIYGFNVSDTIVSDIVSGQYLELKNALALFPVSGVSGDASLNFYSLQLEYWMFPRVNPQNIPIGDPVNPFGVPRNVVLVNPNSNIANVGGTTLAAYYQRYLNNYRLINSPRLKTSITNIYRNQLPQVGDNLQVPVGMKFSADCGRIQSVTLRFGRTGMTLTISAEKYQFGNGLWNT